MIRPKKINFSEFELLAQYFFSVMEGDTHQIESAYRLLRKHNLADEDGFPIYEDEEDEEPTVSKPKPKKPAAD
jgi:hypothetical protein